LKVRTLYLALFCLFATSEALRAQAIQVSRFTQISDGVFYDWGSTSCLAGACSPTSVTIGPVNVTYTFLTGSFSGSPPQNIGLDVPGDGHGFIGGGIKNDTTWNFSQPVAAFGATFVHFNQPAFPGPQPSLPATIEVYTGLNGTGTLVGSMTDAGSTSTVPTANFVALWSSSANIQSAVIKTSPGNQFWVDGIALSLTPATYAYHAGSFAQIASGGGWKTTLTLYNSSNTGASARIKFHADDGTDLVLPISQVNPFFPAAFLDVIVPANGSLTIESEADAAGTPLTGWADVQTTVLPGTLSGFSIFRLRRSGVPDSEGTSVLDTRTSTSTVLGYDNTSGFQTGLALANEGKASTAALTVRDETGTILGTLQIPLADFGHSAFMLTDQFPQAANHRGTVEIQNPAYLTGVSMRFNPTLTFTSLPILR
jgi:hypothetical protein